MLLSLVVLAFVDSAVWPRLKTVTVLFVIFPLASVFRSICVCVNPSTIRLIISPLTLIDIAISMVKNAVPICFTLLPPAIIERAIGPSLLAMSIPQFIKPFAFVDRIGLQRHWPFNDPLLFITSRILSQLDAFGCFLIDWFTCLYF
jgi:hypothetical protein